MRTLTLALALNAMALGAGSLAAQQFGPAPDAATRTEILALREAAWRTWFGNDTTGFDRVVPDELMAMSWDGGPWQDHAGAVAGMAAFSRGGQRIQELEFPENVLQQYGDVVIVYTRFRLVLVDPAGRTSETKGRGTEIFVRRGGRWIHTGWHLDPVAS